MSNYQLSNNFNNTYYYLILKFKLKLSDDILLNIGNYISLYDCITYWKLISQEKHRFTQDVLPCIDRGYKLVGNDDFMNGCTDCYYYGFPYEGFCIGHADDEYLDDIYENLRHMSYNDFQKNKDRLFVIDYHTYKLLYNDYSKNIDIRQKIDMNRWITYKSEKLTKEILNNIVFKNTFPKNMIPVAEIKKDLSCKSIDKFYDWDQSLIMDDPNDYYWSI